MIKLYAFLVLLLIKATTSIAMSWWIVTSPFWLWPVIVFVTCCSIAFFMAGIATYFVLTDEKQENQNVDFDKTTG